MSAEADSIRAGLVSILKLHRELELTSIRQSSYKSQYFKVFVKHYAKGDSSTISKDSFSDYVKAGDWGNELELQLAEQVGEWWEEWQYALDNYNRTA